MTDTPRSTGRIKRLARRYRKEHPEASWTECLNAVSQQFGWADYKAAFKTLPEKDPEVSDGN